MPGSRRICRSGAGEWWSDPCSHAHNGRRSAHSDHWLGNRRRRGGDNDDPLPIGRSKDTCWSAPAGRPRYGWHSECRRLENAPLLELSMRYLLLSPEHYLGYSQQFCLAVHWLRLFGGRTALIDCSAGSTTSTTSANCWARVSWGAWYWYWAKLRPMPSSRSGRAR